MLPGEIARSYDEIAHRWRDPAMNAYGLASLDRAVAFTKSCGKALDVGCGCSGRFIERLTGAGFQAEGLDFSAEMLALAREVHPQLIFHHADICEWEFPHAYDLISAWDSTWHAPLARQESVLRKLCGGLLPGGVLIFTTAGLDAPTEKTDTAMGPPVYYGVLGIPRTLAVLEDCGCVCRHLEYDQYPELHLVIIAQRGAGDAHKTGA